MITLNQAYGIYAQCESECIVPPRNNRDFKCAVDSDFAERISKATKARIPRVGFYAVRRVGFNFGTKRYNDTRTITEIFQIAKITDKMVYGKGGQRCAKADIIAILAPNKNGGKQND